METKCPVCNSENIEWEDIGNNGMYSLYCYDCMKLYEVSDMQEYVLQCEKEQ